MKLNTRINCILLTLLANSFLFGGVNANHHQHHHRNPNHQHHHHRHIHHHHVNRQPANQRLIMLTRILDAIDAIKSTTIFQDLQSTIPNIWDDLAAGLGYIPMDANNLRSAINRTQNLCAMLINEILDNPIQQMQIHGNGSSRNRYNPNTCHVLTRIAFVRGLPGGNSHVYDAIENFVKAIGVILRDQYSFPEAPRATTHEFYKSLNETQTSCFRALSVLSKVYARNAFIFHI